MVKKKWLLAGIDLGTTKICSVVGQVENGQIGILGTGWSPSRGLRKGIVTNLSETIESVRASLEQAEKHSQTPVESAYVSIGGNHLWSINRSGKTEVRGGEVTCEDVEHAAAEAQSFEVPPDWQVTHVLTRSFGIDGHNGIADPVGMSGRQLSVNLHLVLHASAVVQNIVNAVNKAGVLVKGVVMQQLASAQAVLSEDEKELGAVLVDIGGGTTDISIYSQGSICHTEVLPVGGNLITKDIAIGLKSPLREAEEIKREMATVFPETVAPEERIELSEVGTGRRHTVSRQTLCRMVEARCDEMLEAVAGVIKGAGVQSDLVTGVVMTGGGCLMDGLTDRAEQIFQMPVRVGYPINLASPEDAIFHPAYSTALGLLKYAQEMRGESAVTALKTNKVIEQRKVMWIRNWILEKIT